MKRTRLSEHKQHGKNLLPPLSRIGMTPKSWMNDRLPEMLWAALLVGNLSREKALNVFRSIAVVIRKCGYDRVAADLRLSGIAKMPMNVQRSILDAILLDDEIRSCLASLLLFEKLPGKEFWTSAIGRQPDESAINFLMRAVAKNLWHQSEEATDCRWARVLGVISTGSLNFPSSMKQNLSEILNYPNEGDMRHVRPSIRSLEMLCLSSEVESENLPWASNFWAECFLKSPCFPLLLEKGESVPKSGTTIAKVNEVYDALILHCLKTETVSAVDARHDTTFGLAFYSLGILREILSVGNSSGIVGRLGLRAILDAFVTLSYLIHKNHPDLWRSHRVYGAGQAKLSALKLDELKSEKCFADEETLTEIANEDMWEEFLNINVGHWENSSLRREAVEAGVKAEYDKYYAWASSFSHCHWGSVRESVFETCGNPLHRLHRIPRKQGKVLPDVVPDACELVDKILNRVSQTYPHFPHAVAFSN